MHEVSKVVAGAHQQIILPAKEGWHIGIDGSDNAPDIHRVPHRERLASDVREDNLSDNMRKL